MRFFYTLLIDTLKLGEFFIESVNTDLRVNIFIKLCKHKDEKRLFRELIVYIKLYMYEHYIA